MRRRRRTAPTAITEIRQERDAHSTRLVVECTGPVAYTYYSPDPLTLVVDIPEVDASKVPSRISVGTREVESVRVTSMVRADGRSLARIEVRLASLVPYQIYSKDKTLNLVFERGAEAGIGERRRPHGRRRPIRRPRPRPRPRSRRHRRMWRGAGVQTRPRPSSGAMVITPRKRQAPSDDRRHRGARRPHRGTRLRASSP